MRRLRGPGEQQAAQESVRGDDAECAQRERRLRQGRVGKNPGFFLNPAQLGFLVFFMVFLYICPEE